MESPPAVMRENHMKSVRKLIERTTLMDGSFDYRPPQTACALESKKYAAEISDPHCIDISILL
jgi:hypothetical protein